MRIVWNGEIARGVLNYLEDIEQIVADTTGKARDLLPEIESVSPESKFMKRITEAYGETLRQMQLCEESAARLRQGMRRMVEIFEDAEREICTSIQHIDPAQTVEDIFTHAAAHGVSAGIAGESFTEFSVPEAQIMKTPRGGFAEPLVWILEPSIGR